MRVLAVDDDDSIAKLVEQVLGRSSHHEVQTALSVVTALEEIEEAETEFDCFLVDIQMPDVDGITLVKLIRDIPGYEDVPVLMLTAMEDKRYLDRAFSAGATDYISKPFDYQELTSRIQAAQKTAVEKARLRAQPLMAGQMKGMAGNPKDFRLQDPLPLQGVPGAIDYDEFENYVLQLSRGRSIGASVLAVKIGSVDRVYASCDSEEFHERVRRIALVLQDTLLGGKGCLSYRGNGVFLCTPENRVKGSWKALQDAITLEYNRRHARSKKDALQLFVGDQSTLGRVRPIDALRTLSAVVDSAESRAIEAAPMPNMSHRIFAGQWLSGPERRLERRAYEALMDTSFAETKNQAWQRKLDQRARARGRG